MVGSLPSVQWSQSPPNHEACTLWPRRTYLSKNGRLANVELPSRKLKNAICYYRALPGTLEAGVDRGAGPSGSDASFRQHPHRCPPNKSAMRQPSFHAVGENRDSEGRSSQSHRACVWVRGRREREGGGGGVLSKLGGDASERSSTPPPRCSRLGRAFHVSTPHHFIHSSC